MRLLIKSVTIIDPASSHHNKKSDVLIRSGKIEKIGKVNNPSSGTKELDGKNAFLSPGWFDMYAHLKDPGYEHKEDLQTGAMAAARGGFTGVACSPATLPAIHSKSEVEYVFNKNRRNIVDIYPIGAVSYERKGELPTEIYDMYEAGAIAFSDADRPVQNTRLMLRSLQYIKPFNGVILSQADDRMLSASGVINESGMSVKTGMKGMPSLSEEIMIMRDIYLAEYTGSRVHFVNVSTKKGVELIRDAQKKGVAVTASVNGYQLLLDEQKVENYESEYKVYPPLRSTEDIKALKKGLKNGVIGAVCSNHAPQDEEAKKVEFEYAGFGISSLESTYASAQTAMGKEWNPEDVADKMAISPRRILNLTIPRIAEGETANLTLFDPSIKWKFKKDEMASKSRNTPFSEFEFTGKAKAVINNGQLFVI